MAFYTITSLADIIGNEARVGADTEFPIMIRALVVEVLIDAIVRDKPREYFKTDKTVVVTAGVDDIPLPVDFLIPEKIVYQTGTTQWELTDERFPICPARIQGKPASYRFSKDNVTGLANSVNLIPPLITGGPDTIHLDYYFNPDITDSAPIQFDRAIPAIKKEVLQRLQMIQNKPADQQAAILQGYVMASRKDLSANDSQPYANSQIQ